MLTGGGWGGGADAGALTDRAVAAAVLPVQKAVLRLAAAAGTGNGDRAVWGRPTRGAVSMTGRWVIGSVGQQGGELLPDQTGDGAVLMCCWRSQPDSSRSATGQQQAGSQ